MPKMHCFCPRDMGQTDEWTDRWRERQTECSILYWPLHHRWWWHNKTGQNTNKR